MVTPVLGAPITDSSIVPPWKAEPTRQNSFQLSRAIGSKTLLNFTLSAGQTRESSMEEDPVAQLEL